MLVPSMEEQRSVFQLIGCKSGCALPCIIGVGYLSETAYYPEEMTSDKEGFELITVDQGAELTHCTVESKAAPDSLAYILSTSGSTGTPKGARRMYQKLGFEEMKDYMIIIGKDA